MVERESLFGRIRAAFIRDPHEPFVADAEAALLVIEERIKRLATVHRRLILSVTPGSDGFLYSHGPNAKHEDAEAYAALFSEWHAATRELRKLVEEPKAE